jgi:hypothetical protein
MRCNAYIMRALPWNNPGSRTIRRALLLTQKPPMSADILFGGLHEEVSS